MTDIDYAAVCEFFNNAPYELTQCTFPSIIEQRTTRSELLGDCTLASVSNKSAGKGK